KSHQLPRTSIVSWPRLCSLTVADSPHSAQRIDPQANNVEKIMSSNVSPSPSAYHGPSSTMRSNTSAAGASGEAVNERQQLGQYSSTCMAHLRFDLSWDCATPAGIRNWDTNRASGQGEFLPVCPKS